MAAYSSRSEKITVTIPDAMVVGYDMGVVFTLEGNFKRIETDPVPFLSVYLRLLDLTDHSIIHCTLLDTVVRLDRKS